MIDPIKTKHKWPLAAAGVAVLIYSITVLGFVAKTRDLGLRCLLASDAQVDQQSDEEKTGIRIARVMPYLETNATPPRTGDTLLKIAGKRVRTFTEFTQTLADLSTTDNPAGAYLPGGADPNEDRGQLQSIAVIEKDRWIDIEFQRPEETGRSYKAFLKEQSLPLGALSLSLIWFVLHLGIFVVGAMAFWKQPQDSTSRMFFAMCIVTVAAFVGGYHWWVIAARLWLNIPFTICAMLVPVVTLHFFLVFPHRKTWFAANPLKVLLAIYTLPLLATIGMVSLLCHSAWMHAHPASYPASDLLRTLATIQSSVYGYLAIAGIYFAATLAAIYESYRDTKNTAEHNQVKWIFRAAAASTIPVGYTLLLAYFNEIDFALGHARIPMFLASLLFMMAYAVGIVRYKLMLVDQVLSRGMLYLVLSFSVLIVYSLAITLSSLLGLARDTRFLQQAISVTPIVLVSVILLGWIRDRVQTTLDRRFYREKYQLDKVLKGMNQAVAHLVDPATLGRQMLESCRDVLHVNNAAIYLKDSSGDDAFELIAAEGDLMSPARLAANPEISAALLNSTSLQRTTASNREQRSPVQSMLRDLNVNLIHGLEMDGDLAGIVLLGSKRNGDPYTAEDLTFLTALGQIMTLHSSKVHFEITRLNEELARKVEQVTEQQHQLSILQSEIMGTRIAQPVNGEETFRNDLIRGDSPAIHRVLETVKKVAHSESSVLIRGESGTGKELLAQTIHRNSPRRSGPMVRVHCAALSPGLLESELFGHAKGAFTGAHRDKEGRFEMAHGGTLFLDEIGDISLETQVKLLRVLQERSFEPVGGTRTIHVDVRLVTATHQDLEKLILEDRFREDLYYRLNVISITLPPLRDRLEDIFELARFFLNRSALRMGKRISHVDDDAVVILKSYPWPGNIRELENVMERAVVLTDGEVINVTDLPHEIVNPSRSQLMLGKSRSHEVAGQRNITATRGTGMTEPDEPFVSSEAEGIAEQERLLNALKRSDGNKAGAARLLGIPRSTFYSRLKKYRIP